MSDDDWDPPTVGRDDDLKPEVDEDATAAPDRIARRMQERLGVSEQTWFVIESILIFLPYPLFVLIYLTFPVPEQPFFFLTAVYTVFALWYGFRGDARR